MNEQGTELLDSLNRLSLSSLSKSSPSTIQPFELKSTRLMPPLPTNNNTVDKNKPSNLSHVPCKFFKQGTCTAGANCIFSHNPDPSSESSVCKYFRKGNCKFGTKCALLHTMSPYSTSTTTISSSNNKFTVANSNGKQPSSSSSFNSASSRFLYDQFYAANENYTSNDPFASSAPSPSPFSMLSLDERRSKMMSNNDSQFLSSHSYNRPFLFHSSSNSSSSGININQQPPLHSIPEAAGGSRSYRYHHQDEEEEEQQDVNDFMLPSSLNDLLTPTELLGQLQLGSRQPQPQQQQWNVPFYTNGTSSSYSYDESSPPSLSLQPINNRYHQQPITIPNGNSSNTNLDFIVDYPDEDGPFIMEDTCVEPKNTTATPENYSTYNIIKHL